MRKAPVVGIGVVGIVFLLAGIFGERPAAVVDAQKMKWKNESYNKTKRRALKVLENGTPVEGPTFARRVGIRPVRRVYAYLGHLTKLGLVVRRADLGSKVHFQITERGLERLEWLRTQNDSAGKPGAPESFGPLIASILSGISKG